MAAYYNEIDKHAAAWLRELIRRGLIADGEVDERSILDVEPSDLRGFVQCHFFAGIGGWSHALRLAGVPDGYDIWTGSCPCQPFSAAGRGAGVADARHLWPAFWRLIGECRPATVIGEQVGGTAGWAWLDHVFADLEDGGYACAAADFPAASLGAPHIRHRLYWMADSQLGAAERHRQQLGEPPGGVQGEARQRQWIRHDARDGEPTDGGFEHGGMGDACRAGLAQQRGEPGTSRRQARADARQAPERTGASTGGFWSDAIWLPCRDGKARPVGRGIHPLVVSDPKRAGQLRAPQSQDDGENCGAGRRHDAANESENDALGQSRPTEPGVESVAARISEGMVRGGDNSLPIDPQNSAEARVMRLRGYGNAICAPQAAEFVRAAMEAMR